MDIIRHETRRRSSLVGRERSEDSDLEVKACSGFASGWLLARVFRRIGLSVRLPPSAAGSSSAFPHSSRHVLDGRWTVSPCKYLHAHSLQISIDSALQSSCCMHSSRPIAVAEGSLQPHIRVKTGAEQAMHFLDITTRQDGWQQSRRDHSLHLCRSVPWHQIFLLPLVGTRDAYCYCCIDSDLL